MVPGYLFQILLRRRSLTSASCDRKFGTWVLFFQASGGRIWYQGKVLSYQLDRNVLVLLCSYVLPARCIVVLTGEMAPGYQSKIAFGGRTFQFGTRVPFKKVLRRSKTVPGLCVNSYVEVLRMTPSCAELSAFLRSRSQPCRQLCS